LKSYLIKKQIYILFYQDQAVASGDRVEYHISERSISMTSPEKTPSELERKKARTRSPAYPSIGLEEAIRKVDILWDRVQDHFVSMDAIAHEWETNTKSGAFMQWISALKQFGLIEDEGRGEERKARVSEMAKTILINEENSPQRIAVAKNAALSPKIHRELWDKYRGLLPASDSPIRSYLLQERKELGTFNKDHVDSFISQFRSTLAYAKLGQSDIIAKVEEPKHPPNHWEKLMVSPLVEPQKLTEFGVTGNIRELPVTLPSLQIAVLKLPVPMTEIDYTTLVNSLTAMKGALIRRESESSHEKMDRQNAETKAEQASHPAHGEGSTKSSSDKK
jgi:hypothetical protein